MTLKDACISRDGKEDGLETYRIIIEQCTEALEVGGFNDFEEILHDEGFEPDYIMDVIDVLA